MVSFRIRLILSIILPITFMTALAEQHALPLRVMTYNVYNSKYLQETPELHEYFSWAARKQYICDIILQEQPDILGLQEVKDDRGDSVMADLWTYLGQAGYEIAHVRVNPTSLSPRNVIIYNPKKLFLDRTQWWYHSETPEKFSDSWGNGWGNIMLLCTFYPIISADEHPSGVPGPDYRSQPIQFLNVHHGLRHDQKIKSNHLLVDQVAKKIQPNGGTVIVTGDFNTFPGEGGEEEMHILHNAGYYDALSSLKTRYGIPISGSFLGYSYDQFKSPQDRFKSQLDHIFVNPASTHNVHVLSSYLNTRTRDSDNEVGATCEKDVLYNSSGECVRDQFPSDHMPGIVDFELLYRVA